MNAPSGLAVLEFLKVHRLDPSPDHYAFAHRYLSGRDRLLRAKVDAVIDGGVRITAAEVEVLAPPSAPDPANDTIAPGLDRIAAEAVEIIGAAAQGAGSFGRTLTVAAADLLGSDVRRLRAALASMLEETGRAELGLVEMGRRAAALQDELRAFDAVSARRDGSGATEKSAILSAIEAAVAGGGILTVVIGALDCRSEIEATHGVGVVGRLCARQAPASGTCIRRPRSGFGTTGRSPRSCR